MRDVEKPPGNARIAAALLDVLTASGSAAARARAERALEDGTPPRRRRTDWIDSSRLRDAFRAGAVGPPLARRVGRALVAPQAIGLLLSYAGIATPEKAYRRCNALLAREEPGDRFEAVEVGEGRARVAFHPAKPSSQDVLFCSVRLGMLEAMTPLYGLLPARVRESACAHRGAPACVYELSWRRTPRSGLLLGSLVGAVLGAAAGAGLAGLAGLAGPFAVSAALLVSITGAAAGRSIDLARQLDAVAKGGLGHLALLDQADGVLAEKMDLLAKVENAAPEPGAERTLGSSPLRTRDAQATQAAGLARQLHQPVAALQRSLDGLRTLLGSDSSEARALLDAGFAASRELHAIGTQASTSTGEAGSAKPAPADLADIVRRGVASVKSELPDGLEIALAIDCEPAPVRCQPFQLEQVVIQLVTNAAAAMNGRGAVQVELRACPEGYELAVADDGEGIDPEILDALFDPFFEKPPGGDGGLGLTICYRIVKQHGGELAVHSEPGRGTRIAVVLPAEDDASQALPTKT